MDYTTNNSTSSENIFHVGDFSVVDLTYSNSILIQACTNVHDKTVLICSCGSYCTYLLGYNLNESIVPS